MRFIIGLLLGLGVGFALALLFAPEREQHRNDDSSDKEPNEDSAFGANHDSLAGLRRAMTELQQQVQEAWAEAREAAQEAERDMRKRYERAVSKPSR